MEAKPKAFDSLDHCFLQTICIKHILILIPVVLVIPRGSKFVTIGTPGWTEAARHTALRATSPRPAVTDWSTCILHVSDPEEDPVGPWRSGRAPGACAPLSAAAWEWARPGY